MAKLGYPAAGDALSPNPYAEPDAYPYAGGGDSEGGAVLGVLPEAAEGDGPAPGDPDD